MKIANALRSINAARVVGPVYKLVYFVFDVTSARDKIGEDDISVTVSGDLQTRRGATQ